MQEVLRKCKIIANCSTELINSLSKTPCIPPYCVTPRDKSILTCRVMFFSVADWPIVIFLKNLSFVSITEIREVRIHQAFNVGEGWDED